MNNDTVLIMENLTLQAEMEELYQEAVTAANEILEPLNYDYLEGYNDIGNEIVNDKGNDYIG